MVINTNTNAVEAASALQRSSAQLSKSLARLSSGSKIINPSDDAAGLAVTQKLEAQGARVHAAKVNSQNAASMLQTADGFLQSMVGTLNRMSELSMMAQDVTKNSGDIALYTTEFNQLKDQLRNIVGNYTPNDSTVTGGDGIAMPWDISGKQPIGTFNNISLFGPRNDLNTVIGATGDQTMGIAQLNLRDTNEALAELLYDENSATANDSKYAAFEEIDVKHDDAITMITDAIQQVADTRAKLGSYQARLEFVDSQLVVQGQNLEAATSRIRDVDVAEESTRLAKYNILVQSGTAMLSQANSLPESVLRLLG